MNAKNENMVGLSEEKSQGISDKLVRESMEEIFFQPRALVIDDEERIRDACHRLLTEDGFEVECAKNGEAGLQMIEEAHFDIILLDLMMPGLSGFDVL
ncbi:MAG: response regulator transcription factor, partial [Desulfobacterales bacterium]